MRDWLILVAHLVVTTIRTMAPHGARAVIAESLLLKHQLLILKRSRKKAAILEIKRLNPRFGCPRIAQQISNAFGLEIDKDVVRRILANHPLPKSGGEGPSWLTAIAEARDSLWSVDLFRCESVLLKSFWVMLVMDVFTRRIVGFGVEPAHIDGISVCRMSTMPGTASLFPKASVPIMTRCSGSIAGERICAFSTSRN